MYWNGKHHGPLRSVDCVVHRQTHEFAQDCKALDKRPSHRGMEPFSVATEFQTSTEFQSSREFVLKVGETTSKIFFIRFNESSIPSITYFAMFVSLMSKCMYIPYFLSIHTKRQSAGRLSHVEECSGCTRKSVHMRMHMTVNKHQTNMNILKVGEAKFVYLFVFFGLGDTRGTIWNFAAFELSNPISPNWWFEALYITRFSTCFAIKSLGGMNQSNGFWLGLNHCWKFLLWYDWNCRFLGQGLSQDGERQVEWCCVMVRFIDMMLMSLCPKEIMFFEFGRFVQ